MFFLSLRSDKKWCLMHSDNSGITLKPCGYVSSDMFIILKFVTYLNYGYRDDIPERVISDLEMVRKNYIKKGA